MSPHLGFLLDVDNTLLDNDRLKQHMQGEVRALLGDDGARRFWTTYEAVRADLDVVSFPVTLERLYQSWREPHAVECLRERLYNLPFKSFVYPGVWSLLRWLRGQGVPLILSVGDSWYQAKKIADSGLGAAVCGNVLIVWHKEDRIDDVRRWYPADHYVAVDDKADVLGLLKRGFGAALTTIWVRQGVYARGGLSDGLPAPDLASDDIQGVRRLLETLVVSR